jgi:hypothetical protein
VVITDQLEDYDSYLLQKPAPRLPRGMDNIAINCNYVCILLDYSLKLNQIKLLRFAQDGFNS